MESPPEGDAENLSKKRAAFRQLTKDDGLDADDDIDSVAPTGTFKRASDEVLASRRIVKVRRTTPAPSSTNPFASISLVPPSAPSADQDKVVPSAADDEHAIDAGIENESNGKDSSLTQKNITSQATDSVEAEAKGGVVESEGSEDTITGKLQPASKIEDDARNGESEVSQPGGKGESGDNGRVELSFGKGNGSDNVLSFQQHSMDKNAFSFSFGTGFSKSPFSFGVTPSPFSSPVGFGSFGSSSSSFGSVSFGSSFSAARGPQVFDKSGDSNETSDQLFGSQDETPKSANFGQQFQATVSLPEVTVETGEEKEKTIFTADATLFEFIDKAWKERGKGELKVNLSEDAECKARLVMRSRGNLRLLLNANLFRDMRLNRMDSKSVTFACANSASTVNVGSLTTYAVKLKDLSIRDNFIAAVETHKCPSEKNTQKTSPGATKEDEGSRKETEDPTIRPAEVVDESDSNV